MVGTSLAAALSRACELALWPIGGMEVEGRHASGVSEGLRNRGRYDPRAPSLRVWHQFDLAQHVGKGVHAAMPIFELDRFRPGELAHLRAQDVLLACSPWAEAVLLAEAGGGPEVFYVPLGVDHGVFAPRPLPEGGPTVFMSVGKWEVRKGHAELAEAFDRAFEPGDDVLLVLHCHNPFHPRDPEGYGREWERLFRESRMGRAGKVRLTAGRLASQEDVAGLMASAHCGVFPARSEGWNLEASEMLAMGRHVILTDYAGHRAYATPGAARLVEVGELEAAHDGVWFRADDPAWGGRPGRWAALGPRQVEQLVCHMRAVHAEREAGALGQNAAGVEAVRGLDWSKTADAILRILCP